jgi:Protein of unknown function (DUF2947)
VIPLKSSPLAHYFDECSDEDLTNAQFLSTSEAREVWEKCFASKARSLYALPDDCWVARGSWSVVGSWIEAYNCKIDNGDVSRAISAATTWASNEALMLVQGSTQIVALDLRSFNKCWRGLLAAFDDGPILIDRRSQPEACALRFVPMGQILSFEQA